MYLDYVFVIGQNLTYCPRRAIFWQIFLTCTTVTFTILIAIVLYCMYVCIYSLFFYSPSRFRLLSPPKPVQWPKVKWSAIDDAKLLVAIYEHGLGNWEAIKDSDPQGLGRKILPENRALKPQTSHLQTRAEYLLKLLQAEAKRKMAKKSRQSPRKVASSSKGRKKDSSALAQKEITKFFGQEASSQKSGLLVNISRDLVLVNNSDLESNTSSTRSRRGRKRTLPPPKQPTPKKLKPSSTLKKNASSLLSQQQERRPTPSSRTSPQKGTQEKSGGSEQRGGPLEEGVLSGLEGLSDDQRVSDIGEAEKELDQDTFDKVATCTIVLKIPVFESVYSVCVHSIFIIIVFLHIYIYIYNFFYFMYYMCNMVYACTHTVQVTSQAGKEITERAFSEWRANI